MVWSRVRARRCGLVMNGAYCSKFGRFLLGRRIAQEIPAADFGACQIFEQVGRTQRWMNLDVKVEAFSGVAIGWRLMQCEDVGERKPPEIVEANKHVLQRGGE